LFADTIKSSADYDDLGLRVAPGTCGNIAALTTEMIVDEGAGVDLSGFTEPVMTAALAFLLDEHLVGSVKDASSLLGAVALVFPAIDFSESASAKGRDHDLSRVVIGDGGRPMVASDLENVGAVLEIDGAIAVTGSSAAVLGRPSDMLSEVARVLASSRRPLRADTVVVIGGLTPPVAARGGQQARASVGGLGSAAVALVSRS
jgi:2-oxo-3-hexenedioate decarboxylase